MKESVRILRFFVIGNSNALIMVITVWIMMHLLSCNYIVSNIVAYTLAQINNFIWSKYWIFTKKEGDVYKQLLFFCIAFGCAYASQFVFLITLVEVFDMNEYLAQFLGLFIYGAVNFVMNKKITFN